MAFSFFKKEDEQVQVSPHEQALYSIEEELLNLRAYERGLKEKKEEMFKKIQAIFDEHELDHFTGKILQVKSVGSRLCERFDLQRFKQDHPTLAQEYIVQQLYNGYISVK